MEEWDGQWPELEDGQTVDAVLNQPLVRHAVADAEQRGYALAIHDGHTARLTMAGVAFFSGALAGACIALILT